MKNVKKIFILCLALCMVVCFGVFASACGGNDHYSVTVQMPDGTAAKNLRVEFCSIDGSNLRCMSGTTNDNGVADFDIKDYSDTTKFLIHLPEVPDGYTFDANDDGNGGMYVYVKDGYSVTIKLKENSGSSSDTQLIDVSLPNTSSTQKVEPAITVAGFYELRSTTAFTLSGEGYEFNDGYFSVTMYLEEGDSFDIGTTENTRTFSCALIRLTETGATADSAFTASAKSAYVLKLGADAAVHFINPETVNNRAGSVLVFTDECANYKTSATSNLLNLGATFTVSTADNKAGVAVVAFDSPSSGTTVTVGEQKEFDVLLIENGSIMSWVNEECSIRFNADKAGIYTVTVTSSFENDVISITRASYLVGLIPHQLEPDNATSGKNCTASFEINIASGEAYTVTVIMASGSASSGDSGLSQKNVDYTAAGEKVTYFVLVEFAEE